MGGLGWPNPFPLEFGGSPTVNERIYRAMRSAVGIGGSASDDENTIDGVWRQARAAGLAAVAMSGERSLMNAFPGHATDLLPYYEDLLAIVPDDEGDLPSRRAEAEFRFTREIQSAVPQIVNDLQRIDPRFSVLETPRALAIETRLGRAFEDYAGAVPFGGGRRSTRFANFSTEFILFVLFDIGDGVDPGPVETAAVQRAIDHLNDVCAGWVLFQVATADGFILDTSRLDLTGL